jgi:hypothetical protein
MQLNDTIHSKVGKVTDIVEMVLAPPTALDPVQVLEPVD